MRNPILQFVFITLLAVAFADAGIQVCCCSSEDLKGENGIEASGPDPCGHGCCGGGEAPCEKPISKTCKAKGAVSIEPRTSGSDLADGVDLPAAVVPAPCSGGLEGRSAEPHQVGARYPPSGGIPIILLKSSLLL